MVELSDIEGARARLRDVVRPTPCDLSRSLSSRCGRPVWLKHEQLQRTGSFKVRGATNLLRRLPPDGGMVVAASAGNHAQGVALAASLTGRRAVVFMPEAAPLPKVEATEAYGAEVRLEGAGVDECVALATAFAKAAGAVFVPPFDHGDVVAGQGTVGLELAEQAPDDLEVVAVPVGGGGLVSGIAVALGATRPGVRVVGVQPEGAAAMARSLPEGRPVSLEQVRTMADGVAVRSPSPLTLSLVGSHVDEVVTVGEEDISRALLFLLERAKQVVEPAGALGVAALLARRVGGDGVAAAVLSGGNVDPVLLVKLVEHGLSAAGRFMVLRVLLRDRPGALAAVSGAIARLGLNVLAVEHHRAGLDLPIEQVEVVLTVETRGREHADEIVDHLRAAGYPVDLAR